MLYEYIADNVHTQSFFTDVGYGSDGVFIFTTNDENELFLECIVDIYDEDGEIVEVETDTFECPLI